MSASAPTKSYPSVMLGHSVKDAADGILRNLQKEPEPIGRELHVHAQITVLSKAVDELVDITSALIQRLECVTDQSPKLATTLAGDSPADALCGLASEIRGHRWRVESAVDRLRSLHTDLEI